jgi:hypothetical protein
VAGIGHVDADLMGAAGFQPAFDERGATAEILHHPGARHRVAAVVPDHRLPLAVGPVAGQMGGDAQDPAGLEADTAQAAQAGIMGGGGAVDHGKVMAVDRMCLELRGEPVVGAVALGHDQQARGVLVDPVHDAGAAGTADA